MCQRVNSMEKANGGADCAYRKARLGTSHPYFPIIDTDINLLLA
jgi:hypothetical protein